MSPALCSVARRHQPRAGIPPRAPAVLPDRRAHPCEDVLELDDRRAEQPREGRGQRAWGRAARVERSWEAGPLDLERCAGY